MRSIISIVLFAIISVASSCKKSSVAPGTPACIKSTIEANENDPNWEVGEVEEYEFQGKLVYSFNSDYRIIADGGNRIVSNDCNNICYVGGFGGPGNALCNGEKFYEKAVLKRKIWNKYK